MISFVISIQATDTDPSDPRVATATATITIIDINDNSPVFEAMVNYTATVSENEPPNFYVSRHNQSITASLLIFINRYLKCLLKISMQT